MNAIQLEGLRLLLSPYLGVQVEHISVPRELQDTFGVTDEYSMSVFIDNNAGADFLRNLIAGKIDESEAYGRGFVKINDATHHCLIHVQSTEAQLKPLLSILSQLPEDQRRVSLSLIGMSEFASLPKNARGALFTIEEISM